MILRLDPPKPCGSRRPWQPWTAPGAGEGGASARLAVRTSSNAEAMATPAAIPMRPCGDSAGEAGLSISRVRDPSRRSRGRI